MRRIHAWHKQMIQPLTVHYCQSPKGFLNMRCNGRTFSFLLKALVVSHPLNAWNPIIDWITILFSGKSKVFFNLLTIRDISGYKGKNRIISIYWNYSIFAFHASINESFTVEWINITKSKYKHVCARCMNNHLTEPWTGMLGMNEHSCVTFLFAEQIVDGTRVIQANAFITNGCINHFAGWHCIFLPASN